MLEEMQDRLAVEKQVAQFVVALLSNSAYTYYTTQYYAIDTGNANSSTWERLKSDLWSYFKPSDYAY